MAVARTPDDHNRRRHLSEAAAGALGYGGPIAPVPLPGSASCIDCDAKPAPHRGDLKTTRVGPGAVRDEYEYRCTPCHVAHRNTGRRQ